MWKRLTLVLTALSLVAVSLVLPSVPASAQDGPLRRAALGKLDEPTLVTPQGTKMLPSLSGGVLAAAKQQLAPQPAAPARASDAIRPTTLGCRDRNPGGNVRVNQDCGYWLQAEELIKVNPLNPQNLIAGQNDNRLGVGHCGFDYSLDGGRTWGDGIVPFSARVNTPQPGHTLLGGAGTGHVYDVETDIALTFDSQGRAYFGCLAVDIFGGAASGLLVTSSPPFADGSFYNSVPPTGTQFVVVEDNNPDLFHDKPALIADAYPTSPNRDNVYITWTVFRYSPKCGPQPNPTQTSRYCSSTIYGSMSTDHALTWSRPEEISGRSEALCFFGDFDDPARDPHDCTFDQGSDPIVRPNGDLSVVFYNGNTAADNPNSQVLAVGCHPTGDSAQGTARLNCAAPVKVADNITVGVPRCHYDFGARLCIPGAYVVTFTWPRIAVNRINGHLYATWPDYRLGEFDIWLAVSTDGGSTWTEQKDAPVNPDRGMDHHQPAIDVVPNGTGANGPGGDRVAISYYVTGRVPNENQVPPGGFFAPGQPGVQQESTKYMLSGGRQLTTPYATRAVTDPFPPPDDNYAGFLGDYTGLVVVEGRAHPIWIDTRNALPGGFHDDDIFTDSLAIPEGAPPGSPAPAAVPAGRPAPVVPATGLTPNPLPTGR